MSNVMDIHYGILHTSKKEKAKSRCTVSSLQLGKILRTRLKENMKSVVDLYTIINLYYKITHIHERYMHAPKYPCILKTQG